MVVKTVAVVVCTLTAVPWDEGDLIASEAQRRNTACHHLVGR
jgi:hypothetical protein